MKKKPDLSKCKIEYGGEKYDIDLYGHEDYDARGGLWDLAEKCADFVVDDLEGKMFFDVEEQCDTVREAVWDAVYSLIKFRMLRPLNQQIANQSGNKM